MVSGKKLAYEKLARKRQAKILAKFGKMKKVQVVLTRVNVEKALNQIKRYYFIKNLTVKSIEERNKGKKNWSFKYV